MKKCFLLGSFEELLMSSTQLFPTRTVLPVLQLPHAQLQESNPIVCSHSSAWGRFESEQASFVRELRVP